MKSTLLSILVVLLGPLVALAAAATVPASQPARTVAETYPALATGALSAAKIVELPSGQLVKAGEWALTSAQLDGEIAKAPEGIQGQLKKSAFFLAEQMAARGLLLREAKAAGAAANTDERAQLRGLMESIATKITVTDEEIAAFHAQNKDLFHGADLASAKAFVRDMVLQQKQQEAVDRHVRTLGQRMPIEVSAAWVREQAAVSQDNPVDKARASGKPSVVDFGAKGCIPCDKLAPILETLRTKYEGKANVVFVSVREEQILASRYGIQSIPVQIFFDQQGKEVFRHTGFYPQDQIEQRLAEMGVK